MLVHNMKNDNNKNPYEKGKACRKSGMSIHANPYRNTKVDTPINSYQLWESGWTDADKEMQQ